MIEQIIHPKNMHRACIHVVQNAGSAGMDGMTVNELKQYVQTHRAVIATRIINGKYLPQAIKGVAIPKSNGKTRLLKHTFGIYNKRGNLPGSASQ